MRIETTPIEAIAATHLQDLIANGVSERAKLEYKGALPGDTTQEKREFLKDVSSFANASGGHIIYGIRERGGIPTEVCGLGTIDAGAAISRMENMIRDGIRPRIAGVSIGQVELAPPQSVALIIRVSPSWVKPHMVVFQDTSKFYSRNSNGTYSLDVDQLRAAFTLSDRASEMVRNFRLERIDTIRDKRLPVPLDEGPKMILHILPLSGIASNKVFDLSQCERDQDIVRRFPPETSRLWYDLEGVLFYSPQFQNRATALIQIFRNGAVELADRIPSNADAQGAVFETDLEQKTVEATSQLISIQGRLGVEPPYYAAL